MTGGGFIEGAGFVGLIGEDDTEDALGVDDADGGADAV